MRFAAGVGACSALPFTLKFILGANPKSRAIYITRVANYPLPLTEKLSAKKKRTGFQSKLSQIRTKRKLIILRVGILILLKSKLEKDTNKERNRIEEFVKEHHSLNRDNSQRSSKEFGITVLQGIEDRVICMKACVYEGKIHVKSMEARDKTVESIERRTFNFTSACRPLLPSSTTFYA